jgi:hypothetical protein
MWRVEPTTQWDRDAKHYQKKHPNELAAIFRNVGRYLSLLNCATNARSVQAGFLHPEPMGVVAVEQKGGGANLQETRAYTYADEAQKVLYIITIGNKQEQPSDIELSKDFVKNYGSTTTT